MHEEDGEMTGDGKLLAIGTDTEAQWKTRTAWPPLDSCYGSPARMLHDCIDQGVPIDRCVGHQPWMPAAEAAGTCDSGSKSQVVQNEYAPALGPAQVLRHAERFRVNRAHQA